MSLLVQFLQCDACDERIAVVPLLPSVYVFPTGELLRLHSSFGWCRDCQGVLQVEALPSVAALDQEEAALLALARTLPEGLSKYEKRDLEGVGLYRRLLAMRQSPGRCMCCGGSEIDHWTFEEPGITAHSPHGGCQGRFRQIDDPDGMRLMLVDDANAFSPDGTSLGRLSDQPGFDGTEAF